MHLKRILALDSSNLSRNLELLFSFTFVQSEADCIFDCLQIWESVVENGIPQEFPVTKPIFLSFLEKIVNELLTGKQGSGELSEKALDLVSMLSFVYPSEITSLFVSKFNFQYERFRSSVSDVRDLISIIKVIGRITGLFEESFMDTFPIARSVIDTHVAILEQIDQIQSPNSSQYQLMNTTYSSLALFLPWISTYRSKAVEFSQEEEENCNHLIKKLITGAVGVLLKMQNKSNLSGPSRFLTSISSSLRPNCMQIDSVNQLLLSLQTNRSIPLKLACSLWKFATNVFVNFPFGQRALPKDWTERGSLFKQYLSIPLQNFLDFFNLDIAAHPNPNQIRSDILISLHIMNSVLLATKDGSPQSRDVAYTALSTYTDLLPQYFPFFINDSEGAALIVELLANSTETLKTQIVKSGKIQMIAQSVYTLQSFFLQLNSQSKPSLELINHAFCIFSVIVQEKAKHFEPLLREMIIFCSHLNEKHGLLGEEELEIFTCLDSLVNQILRTHWTHFFGSKIQSKTTKYTTLERQQEFLVLFQIMAMSFAYQETDLIRQNLKNMVELNEQFTFFQTVHYLFP